MNDSETNEGMILMLFYKFYRYMLANNLIQSAEITSNNNKTMQYSDFTLDDLEEKFGIKNQVQHFENILLQNRHRNLRICRSIIQKPFVFEIN